MGPQVDNSAWLVCLQSPCARRRSTVLCSRYIISVLLKRVFLFKCTLPLLRLTPLLALLALPPVLTRLLCFHRRERPSPILSPLSEAVVLSAFPIAWFFGFLYYTELPSVLAVAGTVVAASRGRHWLAGLVRDFVLYDWG
jgi:alpha-1,2-glucosyltransferase